MDPVNPDVADDNIGDNESENSTESTVDPIEAKARELGWKPKDEFEGDPAQWRSAEIFVDKQPLFEKIQQQNKQLTKAQQAIAQLQEHNAKVEQAGYDRALKELKAARKAARRDDDFDRIDEIEDEIEEIQVKKAQASVTTVRDPAPEPQVFVEWKQQNQWYDSDSDMKATADVLGLKYADLGLPAETVFARVTADVKKLYPEKFRNPNRDKPSGVTGESPVTKGGDTSNSLSAVEKSMSAQERQVMNKLVKTGHLTKKKYLEDLQKIKGVE